MAKLRRYRRYYRKSGKWAANIQEINAILTAPLIGTFSSAETIVTNPTQQATRTAQTYTIKNVEITFTIEHEGTYKKGLNLEGITIYIMFVPQGMNVTNDYNINHPEYIMAYKYIGSPSAEIIGNAPIGDDNYQLGQTYQPQRIKTRLARKLQSGDNIILFIKGINQHSTESNFRINGIIRWWSKAN